MTKSNQSKKKRYTTYLFSGSACRRRSSALIAASSIPPPASAIVASSRPPTGAPTPPPFHTPCRPAAATHYVRATGAGGRPQPPSASGASTGHSRFRRARSRVTVFSRRRGPRRSSTRKVSGSQWGGARLDCKHRPAAGRVTLPGNDTTANLQHHSLSQSLLACRKCDSTEELVTGKITHRDE